MILTVTQRGLVIQITILALLIVIVPEEPIDHQVEVIVVFLVVITAQQEVIQVAGVAVQSLPHDHLVGALFMKDASLHHHIDLVEEAHRGAVLEGVHTVVIVGAL